jgi:hypothetical protein
MFYILSDFVFHLSPGSLHWPVAMHEPLLIGIALPSLSRPPWTLQRMPKVVGLERQVRGLSASSEADGRDLPSKLQQILQRVAGMPESLAR